MSVHRQDFIVYGWKLPYDLKNFEGNTIDFWNNEKTEILLDNNQPGEFTLISDGMNGEYNVFGILISSCPEDFYDGWRFVNLDTSKFEIEKVKAKYREIFDLKEDEIISDPILFIFSHFT